jgi:hypothetical protein
MPVWAAYVIAYCLAVCLDYEWCTGGIFSNSSNARNLWNVFIVSGTCLLISDRPQGKVAKELGRSIKAIFMEFRIHYSCFCSDSHLLVIRNLAGKRDLRPGRR